MTSCLLLTFNLQAKNSPAESVVKKVLIPSISHSDISYWF